MGNKNCGQPGSLGFKKFETSDEIMKGKDFTNKNVAITGTSSGIGCDTARVFFERGANVYCFNRNLKKAQNAHKAFLDAAKDKEDVIKGGSIHDIQCDLASLQSVKNSVKNFTETYPNTMIDYVFANAGVMSMPHTKTVDGFDTMMGINHFNHSAWVLSILPFINEPGRIVVVSSIAHRFGSVNFDDMHYYERSFGSMGAYGQSKLGNVYFTRELNRLLKQSKKNILALTLHPGSIRSGLGGHSTMTSIGYTILGVVGYNKTIKQGSGTQIVAAIGDKITEGGHYLDNCDISSTAKAGDDMEIAKKLFQITLLDTGMRYPFDVEGEDPNNLEGVKSSRPNDWIKIVEKEKGIKIEEKKEEEVEGEKE